MRSLEHPYLTFPNISWYPALSADSFCMNSASVRGPSRWGVCPIHYLNLIWRGIDFTGSTMQTNCNDSWREVKLQGLPDCRSIPSTIRLSELRLLIHPTRISLPPGRMAVRRNCSFGCKRISRSVSQFSKHWVTQPSVFRSRNCFSRFGRFCDLTDSIYFASSLYSI